KESVLFSPSRSLQPALKALDAIRWIFRLILVCLMPAFSCGFDIANLEAFSGCGRNGMVFRVLWYPNLNLVLSPS
ncbi:heparinase ii iii family protein, partial [Moniliophthora roreri]